MVTDGVLEARRHIERKEEWVSRICSASTIRMICQIWLGRFSADISMLMGRLKMT